MFNPEIITISGYSFLWIFIFLVEDVGDQVIVYNDKYLKKRCARIQIDPVYFWCPFADVCVWMRTRIWIHVCTFGLTRNYKLVSGGILWQLLSWYKMNICLCCVLIINTNIPKMYVANIDLYFRDIIMNVSILLSILKIRSTNNNCV